MSDEPNERLDRIEARLKDLEIGFDGLVRAIQHLNEEVEYQARWVRYEAGGLGFCLGGLLGMAIYYGLRN